MLTALVYATTHFIGRYRVAAANVNAGSGIDMLAHTLGVFAQPLHFIDAFLCLLAVGVLLGMVRVRTGNIAATIGLHAGWVAVIYVVREATDRAIRTRRAPGCSANSMASSAGWCSPGPLVLGIALVLVVPAPGRSEPFPCETATPAHSFTTVSRRT